MEKANKPLPGCAYPNEHDPRDLYNGRRVIPPAPAPPPVASSSVAMPPGGRGAAHHRKLSDYCGIFAEKTNRIGRNVESFMQSRGLLPNRRSVDETPRHDQRPAARSNGDVARNDLLTRGETARRHPTPEHRPRVGGVGGYDEDRGYERATLRRGADGDRSASYPAYGTYPRESSRVNASYVHRANETEPRRSRRREYAASYDRACGDEDEGARVDDAADNGALAWRDATVGASVAKPILRNGINHVADERSYRSTPPPPPRRSRTINFRDQTDDGCQTAAAASRRTYPKSLRDLTDLELDDVAYLAPELRRGDGLDDYRRREERRGNVMSFDDDYLRLCRNLARLDGYSRDGGAAGVPGAGRYEPGQVHYERECRTFGKDTVAFIYYKTCYL